jgi:hypothetical protein
MPESDAFTSEVLVAASRLVESLTPIQRKRLASGRVQFLKIHPLDLEPLVSVVDKLHAVIDEANA